MSLTRDQLNNWLKTIDVDCDKVGDIGIGNKPNKNNVRSFKCNEYIGFDIEKTDYVQKVIDLNKPYDKYQNYFDVIFSTEVYEHLIDPLMASRNIYGMLKNGGIFYMSVVFIYPHHGQLDYLRYTDYGLRKIFETVGFKEIEITKRLATDGFNSLKKFYIEEGMHSPELRENYDYPIGYCVKAKKI